MREEREKLRKLLRDTVSMLCRNSLQYERHLRIEGVIGITVDDDDAFLIHINDNVGNHQYTTTQDMEHCRNIVKSEYGYSEGSGIQRPETVMYGFQSSDMSSSTAAAASSDHITSTVVSDLFDIKADDVMEEDVWEETFEESYSDLVYPWTDTTSSISSYPPPPPAPPVAQYHSRPKMMVCATLF